MTRIVVLDDYQGVALGLGGWDRLPPGCEVVAIDRALPDTDELVAALEGAEVVIAMRERTRFDAERLARLPDLRLLVTTGMANASIDLEAATGAGITVSGTRGRGGATLELTWGLILAVARSIPQEDANVRAGGWQSTVGLELDGATLGIVGLGRLGAAMVPVARAFGMEVVAWSQNLTPERAAEAGVRAVTKEELFSTADVVSIQYKLGPRSVGLVGAAELALMRPTAYLVNTSRGPIVDTPALLDALHAGRIAGAALDVFDEEPLPVDHPLRSAPRTVLSPHLGYVSGANYAVFYRDAVDDVLAYLDGTPVRVLEAA
ncbi:D-2-hydroxyacid dehydrogenase family protein [Patulibacter sp. NPDC049589]|uniref:D-2-hydroxyacid dehydrogenase family protein n=1 Tax=Patulibacter sp. NPDC049589 TaxID=3154731 RepID=UPI0034121F6D